MYGNQDQFSTRRASNQAKVDRLPWSKDGELSVLGAILLDNAALSVAKQVLAPRDFYAGAHRCIFTEILALAEAGSPIDLTTLNEALERSGKLDVAGGTAYLAALVDGVPRVSNVGHYARIVHEKSLLRRAARLANETYEAVLAKDAQPSVLAEAAEKLGRLAAEASGPDGSIRKLEDVPSLSELKIDPMTWTVEQLFPAQAVTLVAGIQGNFKSWFALVAAKHIARGEKFLGLACEKTRVLYLDRENPAGIIEGRRNLIGVDARDKGSLLYWGSWEQGLPPLIGDKRLREWASAGIVLIFDTLSRFHDKDENKSWEIRKVMDELRHLANLGATVIVLHHASSKALTSWYRGSTGIVDGVDVGFSIERVDDGSNGNALLRIKTQKTRLHDFCINLRPDFESSGGFLVEHSRGVDHKSEVIDELDKMIRATPGISQRQLIQAATSPQHKVREVLRNAGSHGWKASSGPRNSLLYHLA